MSSGYIYNPPPPPPPRATASTGPQNCYPSQRGGRGRGRGNRGGFNNPQARNNNSQGRGNRYASGRSNNSSGDTFSGPHTQQRLAPSSASAGPNVHFNPAFFPGLQAPQISAPLSQSSQQSLQTPSTSLFYSAPLPSPVFYGDLASTTSSSSRSIVPPAQASYSHFAPSNSTNVSDTPPPSKKQRLQTSSGPDMTEAEWLALNGGKLIGTNVLPPQTDDEIAAWIAERKKRFPSRATQAERDKEKTERERKKKEADREHWKMKNELQQAEDEEKMKKEQAIEERKARLRMEKEEEKAGKEADGANEKDDDDGPPEEISGKIRTVIRDDRKKNRGRSQKLCREFQQKGRCSRGAQCWLSHKVKEKYENNKGKDRKSLYQRFLENDRDHDNEFLVKVIKYLGEHRLLTDPTNEDSPRSENQETQRQCS